MVKIKFKLPTSRARYLSEVFEDIGRIDLARAVTKTDDALIEHTSKTCQFSLEFEEAVHIALTTYVSTIEHPLRVAAINDFLELYREPLFEFWDTDMTRCHARRYAHQLKDSMIRGLSVGGQKESQGSIIVRVR